MSALKRKMMLIILLLLLIVGGLLYIVIDTTVLQSVNPKPEVVVETKPEKTETEEDKSKADGEKETVIDSETETSQGEESVTDKKEDVVDCGMETEKSVDDTESKSESVTEKAVVTVDTDSSSSLQKIVNHHNEVEESYVPDNLVLPEIAMTGTQYLRKEAADALEEMNEAARQDGLELKLISGYRSYKEQLSLYYTYERTKGRAYTTYIDCIPGQSEHQLGLGLDIGAANGECELSSCFYDTKTSKWLKEHAYEYGFIQRYPYQKENITGIIYSPWHYRYLGKNEAKKVYESGLTLEEYYNKP